MTRKRFYPASIVDEVGYLFEQATSFSLTFGFIMTLEGRVDSEAVRKALDASLNVYPKLKCVLSDRYTSLKRWFSPAWEYREVSGMDILKEIAAAGPVYNHRDVVSDFEQYHHAHAIDITRQPPLKVLLIRSGHLVHLIFFVHHAAADGLAVIFFVQTFIRLYESIFYQQKGDGYGKPDFESISRPRVTLRLGTFAPRIINTFRKSISRAQKEPPALLLPRDGEGEKKIIAAVRVLTPEQFQLLRTRARQEDATINNYLLASMFRTIKNWNCRWHDTSRRIYVSVPINLRLPDEATVGNVISGYYFSVGTDAITDRSTVLGLMRKEWPLTKEYARQNVNLLWLLKPLPLAVKRKMFKRQSSAFGPTLLLSNWGICNLNPGHRDREGFHCMGQARIREINTIPHPVRWPQLTVITYNNILSISFSVLRSHFPPDTADEFLRCFSEELLAEGRE